MSFALELAKTQFVVAEKLARGNLVVTQIDSALCEDNRTISTHVYCEGGGEPVILASVMLPDAIDPTTFDQRRFERSFMEALTARPRHLN